MKIVSDKRLKTPLSRFFTLAFAILSLTFVNFAQDGGRATLASQVNQVKEFDVNGLKVLVKRRPSSPTVAVGLFVRGGSRNLTPQNAGIESFMLNTMTEASQKFPRELLRKELSRMASTLGAGSNADYSALSLASTRQNFDRTWEIFTDVVLNPAFASEDVENVRERILTGLRNQAVSPDSNLQLLQDKVIYANHPYVNDPNGSIEIVGKLKAEDLKAYHQKIMQTSRLLLVVVGDVDGDALQKQIAATFGKLPRGDYKETPLPTLNFSTPTLDVTPRNSLQTNYIKGIFAAPNLNDADYYAMRVAMTILQSRVYQEVRVKRNLSYAPNAEMDDNASNTANIYVTAADANTAVSVMLKEIESLKKGVSDETDVSGFFLTTYYLKQETNAAQAGELAKYELTGGGWRNSFSFLDKVKSVTPEDIQRVAQKYMKNLRFVVLGNPSAVNREIFLPKN